MAHSHPPIGGQAQLVTCFPSPQIGPPLRDRTVQLVGVLEVSPLQRVQRLPYVTCCVVLDELAKRDDLCETTIVQRDEAVSVEAVQPVAQVVGGGGDLGVLR